MSEFENDPFRVLEAIVTTENSDGSMHVAPMGPHVSASRIHWMLKPFQTSTTFKNLYNTNRCVVNVVDDVLLLAQSVLGNANSAPARWVDGCGFVLSQACHWYGLEINHWDCSEPRAIASCHAIDHGMQHSFFGWNRAKHAVVELAILASRLHLLEPSLMESEIDRLKVIIDKTAATQEREAFDLLVKHIHDSVSSKSVIVGEN